MGPGQSCRPRGKLRAESRQLAARIAEASALVLALGKQAYYAQIDLDQPKAYAYAKEVMSRNALSQDAQEGISAFLESAHPAGPDNDQRCHALIRARIASAIHSPRISFGIRYRIASPSKGNPHGQEDRSRSRADHFREQAAAFVKSGMWLDYGAGLGQPDVFDQALAARKDESLHNVKIRSCLSMRPRAVLEADPEGKHFFLFSWHFSGYDRKKHDAGRCNYLPLNLGEVPDYYRRFLAPVDIAILKTCPMDENGYLQLQRRQSLAPRRHRKRQDRHRRSQPKPALCLRRRQRRPRQRGRLHHRRRQPAAAGTAQSRSQPTSTAPLPT